MCTNPAPGFVAPVTIKTGRWYRYRPYEMRPT
jgi:hypothetical protein